MANDTSIYNQATAIKRALPDLWTAEMPRYMHEDLMKTRYFTDRLIHVGKGNVHTLSSGYKPEGSK